VAQIYPRALGSLSVASYYSQVYGGGILSRLHCEQAVFSLLNSEADGTENTFLSVVASYVSMEMRSTHQ
jgi:hypothetical protein